MNPKCLGCLLDEVVDELRRGVVHLHVEVLEAARQVVVEPARRNRDEQPERGLDERFCNTGRHGADTPRPCRGDADEGVDDADHGTKQSDERCRRSDGRERADAFLEVRGRVSRGTLNGAEHGYEQVITYDVAATLMLDL